MLDRVADKLLGLPAAESPDLQVDRDLRIEMPDGVVLLADRYRPRGAGPLPVVLMRTPYGRRTLLGTLFGSMFGRRGYQVLLQSVRGTFGSGGEFWPFHQEKEDGLATAAWVREQPWCDGRIATAGPSYLGHTQWALAPYLDPPPVAMCLSVTAADFAETFYPGGVLGLDNMLSWSSAIGVQEDVPFGGLLPSPLRERRVRRSMAHLPLSTADLAAIGKPERFLREVVGHAEPEDRFWAPIDHRGADGAALDVPVSMVTGWYDLFLPSQLRDFRRLAEAGGQVRITVGPWAHADPGMLKASVHDQLSWLSAHLRDDVSELQRAPVKLYLQGAGRWLDFERWPPPSAATELYLHDLARLEPRPPKLDTADRFRYDPADPTPSVGGPLLTGKTKQRDNRETEARDDVLVYTGTPLTHDLDLIGDVSARVHLRTDTGHADVFVRLCDVDRAGVSRNVCDGILRLRPGFPAAGEDGVVTAEVELSPTAYRFRRGHRLRVQIAGGAFPRFARNQGTGEPAVSAVHGTPTEFTLVHSPARPSHITIPVFSPAR
ncbi:CocE/NonD family hydrolase [Amycolatopsis nigrescens]|uniref:CocE/NonD family hydrolase n=1 Tax=Amycolatopsis nigrescens TaxID=381445 RepID=UPI000378D217|nr:CocE/NonD family hydrolase [Amycolatopsis nigrescens]